MDSRERTPHQLGAGVELKEKEEENEEDYYYYLRTDGRTDGRTAANTDDRDGDAEKRWWWRVRYYSDVIDHAATAAARN